MLPAAINLDDRSELIAFKELSKIANIDWRGIFHFSLSSFLVPPPHRLGLTFLLKSVDLSSGLQ
jgi:hypothetical protein